MSKTKCCIPMLRIVACLITMGSIFINTTSLTANPFHDHQPGTPPAKESDPLKIDPLLVVQANVVWRIIASDDNPIWPGWNAKTTPILFYLPGVQDVLINHPKPPQGFVPYQGPISFVGGKIMLRSGKSLIEWDGQNTARDINGVETLIVADTLSNRKNWLRGLLNNPAATEKKLKSVEYFDMAANPYSQMATIVHEAFHVFQFEQARGKGANEMHARLYPCLSVENNVGVALEGQALAECLRAKNLKAARSAAVRWLALRRDRRAKLSAEAIAYEDGNEFSEGLAMYTELRLAEVLQGKSVPKSLWLAQGFRGLDDLTHMRKIRIERLLMTTSGKININNDRYGMSPVRSRLYFSGMAIAALLDRFDSDWKSKIFKDGVTLTDLASRALSATEAELSDALASSKSGSQYEKLVAEKKALASAGLADTMAMVKEIRSGPKTSLIIDYQDLGTKKIGLSFTPFGVRRVDENQTIYTLVPIRANLGSSKYQFRQSVPAATLQDRKKSQFIFQLSQKLTSEQITKIFPSIGSDKTIIDLDVEICGVKIVASKATVTHEGNSIVIRLAK